MKMLLLDIYTKRKRLTSKNKDNLLAGVMMTKAMTNKNGLNFKLVELCMAGKKRGDKNTKPKRNWTRWTRLPWSKLIIYILMWNIVSSTELVSCDGMTVCSVQPVERKSVTCAYIFYVAQYYLWSLICTQCYPLPSSDGCKVLTLVYLLVSSWMPFYRGGNLFP